MKYELGFIGAGNMAEAIARAAIARNILTPNQIIAADPGPDRTSLFATLGVTVTHDNNQVITQARQLLLAIKPQSLPAIADPLKAIDPHRQIVLSIMAGVTADKITQAIGRPARVLRIMPNTPLLVGQGMTAIALGKHAKPGDEELAVRLFSAAGRVIAPIPEELIDAVTAVSGSGPAYLFYLAQAMESAARELGLGDHSPLLVRQTILGAAQLLAQSADSPAELRRKVTSPGGTTEAAIKHLDAHKTPSIIIDAIKAAHHRSKQLGS